MPDTPTTPDNLPRILDSDSPDIPRDMNALADATQAALNRTGAKSFASVAARDAYYVAHPDALIPGAVSYLQDFKTNEQYIDGIWHGIGDFARFTGSRTGALTEGTWTKIPLTSVVNYGRTFSLDVNSNIFFNRGCVFDIRISCNWQTTTNDSYTIGGGVMTGQAAGTYYEANAYLNRYATYTRLIASLQLNGGTNLGYAPQLFLPLVMATSAGVSIQATVRCIRNT